MNKTDLQHRTKKFALEIIKLAEHLPNNRVGWTFTDQIVRSPTSVAANYRAVCRAKSDKDFGLKDSKIESNELVSIFVASAKTVKSRLNQQSKISN
ncbi:four helix bundle protein [Reichenbachiella carrageenanivorans]|uniref:Four helix bundle protein n=1 Tax=Reichenbachiella carrageenanivorans TaxID=2979869 RepID=A0ABY6CZ11_9BACT|nr:four helix bundle protein [Reichenbachiella carrageenanivorans]UXX79146.1 four helix bundle protein [Reichenbachiella carrageenanivorans]